MVVPTLRSGAACRVDPLERRRRAGAPPRARAPHRRRRAAAPGTRRPVVQLQLGDDLRVAAVEAFRQPHDRAPAPCTVRARAAVRGPRIPRAIFFGVAAPVVAGDQRDDLDLRRLEAAQVAVLDQVIRVLVMPLVADVDADVVQQRGVFEPFALAVRQAVNRAGLIEQRQRQPARPAARGRASSCTARRARSRCGAARRGSDRPARSARGVALDVVEHQPFAQREIAQRDFLGAQPPQNRVEQDRAGDDQVGAPRIEPGHAQALLESRARRQPLSAAGGVVCAATRRLRTSSAGALSSPPAQRAEAEDRARRADHAVEAGVRESARGTSPISALMCLHQPALVARVERIASSRTARSGG